MKLLCLLVVSSPDSNPQPCCGDRRPAARCRAPPVGWLLLCSWRGCCQGRSCACLPKTAGYSYPNYSWSAPWCQFAEQAINYSPPWMVQRLNWEDFWAWKQELTDVNRLLQLGVVLHSQQRLVVTSVALQLFLSPAGCHPDLRPVLIRYSFANKPFHFTKHIHVYFFSTKRVTEPEGRQQRAPNLFTCHILLHLRLLLQELGPSHGPPVQDHHVLVHHVLVGLVVVRPLKAVGVNPARIGTWEATLNMCNKNTEETDGSARSLTRSPASPPFLLPPIPWWWTRQQPPLGKVSAAGRSNASAEWSACFKLPSGISDVSEQTWGKKAARAKSFFPFLF